MNIPADKMEEFEAAALDAVERKMDEPEYCTGGLDLEEATFLAARVAVESAIPFIAAQALRQEARDIKDSAPPIDFVRVEDVIDALLDSADYIEKEAA